MQISAIEKKVNSNKREQTEKRKVTSKNQSTNNAVSFNLHLLTPLPCPLFSVLCLQSSVFRLLNYQLNNPLFHPISRPEQIHSCYHSFENNFTIIQSCNRIEFVAVNFPA
jgi:hypothetical protein